jgi:hypothetical protein
MSRAAGCRRRSVPAALALVVGVAVGSAACSSPQGQAARTTGPAVTTTTESGGFVPNRLQVVGSTLELSSGGRFFVRGVEVYAMPFYDDDGQPDAALASVTEAEWSDRDAIFARIAALGADTVRIQITAHSYNHDYYGLGGSAGYLARLVAFVRSANAAGLEVILTWSDAVGERAALLTEYPTQLEMMSTVAAALRSDPDVLYEPYNEPNGMSWAQWAGLVKTTLAYWRRTIGYSGPLILDTPDYSWAFEPSWASDVVADDAALLGRPNVLIANHRYPNQQTCFCGAEEAAWVSMVGRYTRQIPVIGTEYGVYDGTGPEQLQWGRQFLDYVSTDAGPGGLNGAVAFVWDWVDPDSMTDTAGALTAWGKVVAAELLAPAGP